MAGKLLRARQSFWARLANGEQVMVHGGKTIAEEGSEIVRNYPQAWEVIVPDHRAESRVEQATAAPGERRER
jgi:hypothetical protein